MDGIPVQIGGDRHKHAIRMMTGWRVDETDSWICYQKRKNFSVDQAYSIIRFQTKLQRIWDTKSRLNLGNPYYSLVQNRLLFRLLSPNAKIKI